MLLYCVAPETAPGTKKPGIGGAPVEDVALCGLRWFFSEAQPSAAAGEALVAEARAFNAVLQDLFSRTAILPFRYPTTVCDHGELEKLAAERAGRMRDFLAIIEGKAQLDVRFSFQQLPPEVQSTSGAGYLRTRANRREQLAHAAELCRQSAPMAEFKLAEGRENIRCSLLVPRPEVVLFVERMRTLALPDGIQAAVSGPWPPTAFWEDDPR